MRQTRTSILAEMRRRIVEGRLAPGARIPTRPELESEFGASRHTVQHAIDQLRREGFVRVAGRQATYVVSHPPHLYHYALVFNSRPGHDFSGWSRFFRALVTEAQQQAGVLGESRHISVHYGVENHADNAEFQKLAAMVRDGRLAGLILPEHPGATGLTALVSHKGVRIPWVSFSSSGGGCVRLAPFVDKVMDAFVRQGRRRVALIVPGRPDLWTGAVTAARGRGLIVRPYWVQPVDLHLCACARHVAHLLFNANQTERPDALFVADDNLVEYALAGVLEAGVRVPDDLTIMAHWNFPAAHTSVVPIGRVGFDAAESLAACLTELESQQGGRSPRVRTVHPLFEDELQQREGRRPVGVAEA